MRSANYLTLKTIQNAAEIPLKSIYYLCIDFKIPLFVLKCSCVGPTYDLAK